MFVKKFEAESFEQALALVKNEMGKGALILSTHHKKNRWYQKGKVEVTAALEKPLEPAVEEQPKKAAEYDEETLKEVFIHRREVPQVAAPAKKTAINRYLDISDQKSGEAALPPAARTTAPHWPRLDTAQNPYETSFLQAGFSPESAREFSRALLMDFQKRDLENPQVLNQTKARLVAAGLDALNLDVFATKSSWIAVGAPGSGKTSLLVKLALYLKKRNRFVELVSLDSRKVVGRAELAAYARLTGLPFREKSVDREAIGRVQLADSPAFCWRNKSECDELAGLCGANNILLVVDATQRLSEVRKTLDAARRFVPAAIALSRVDMVSDFGVIFDILKYAKLPLLCASVSRSFKVPAKFFEPLELAHFIVSSSNLPKGVAA